MWICKQFDKDFLFHDIFTSFILFKDFLKELYRESFWIIVANISACLAITRNEIFFLIGKLNDISCKWNK